MQNRKRDTDVQNRLLSLWEKERVGCFKRTASKHVYYLRWNRSPAQVGCMRQVLGADALGRPRGSGWRGRWEGGLGRGIHVNPCLIHVNVWQKPLQYCKVISLQLIKINEKKENRKKKGSIRSNNQGEAESHTKQWMLCSLVLSDVWLEVQKFFPYVNFFFC